MVEDYQFSVVFQLVKILQIDGYSRLCLILELFILVTD